MIRTSLLLLLLAALVAPGAAFAAKKKQKPAANPGHEADKVTIEVPQSELDVGSQLDEGPGNVPASVELGVSSWSPDNFTRPSYQGNAPKFTGGSFPYITLNRTKPFALFPGNGASLSYIIGISYGQLERAGTVSQLGSGRPASETLSLVSARAGVEYGGPRFASGTLQPFATFSVLPSYALAPQSQYEDRVSEAGVPFEASAGIFYHAPFLRDFLTVTNGTFGISAHYLFGSIDSSKLAGLGVQGLFAVTL